MIRFSYIFLFISSLFSANQSISQNNSLHFDGSNDRVEVSGNTSVFNSPNTLTVEAWINADAWKAQQWQGTILGNDNPSEAGFVLRCGNNGRLSFTVGTANSWTEVVSNPVMKANTWHHVAGVMDNGTLRIYIDGKAVGSKTSSPILNSNSSLYIGESAGFAGRVFDGKIDEVRIWDIVRTQAEIQSNDTVNLDSNTSGLIAYYQFNETSGDTVFNKVATPDTKGVLKNFSNNARKDGFAEPSTDMSVGALLSPDRITFFNGPSKVRARFLNSGTDTVSSFSVNYQLNNETTISENINRAIPPGSSFDHSFSTIISKTDSISKLKIFVKMADDVNTSNDTIEIEYRKSANSNELIIPIFKKVQHNFGAAGQSHLSTVTLPDNNIKYSQILMDISVSCPSSGCDPWDQSAKISLLKNGKSYEIARFITPYRKACGPWTVDVTDFKTLLQGSCDFSSYIQVWGSSGWLLDVSLIFIKEKTAYPFQKLTSLWSTDNWVYGDPNISYDLPSKTIGINTNTKQTEMRMTITGHGQGNTSNAAEFSNFTHRVTANGINVANHQLYNTDCATNSCSNQFGTWRFSRAGWCPGEAVDPYHVDLSNSVTIGQDLTVDYVLQNYTNLLNTGYNNNGHTEPHYKIHAYLVEKSDQYIDSTTRIDLAIQRFTSPLSKDSLMSTTPVSVMLKNYGSTTISNPSLRLIINGIEVASEAVNNSNIQTGDSLEYTFAFLPNFNARDNYDISVVLDASNDEAASNDVSNQFIDGLVGINETNLENQISLYPNPNTGQFLIDGNFTNQNLQITIFDLNGKIVYEKDISPRKLSKSIETNLPVGSYIVKIANDDSSFSKSMIIVE